MTIDELKKKKVGFISLGCDKNRVDLEHIIFDIKQFGLEIVNDPSEANIIIVNTCSFIEPSRIESINTILEMANYKQSNLEKLIVTGCLPEYKFEEVKKSIPEIDILLKIGDNKNIITEIAKSYSIEANNQHCQGRELTTPKHYAYLKISEGCNNFCAYCTIPFIRGRFVSRPMKEIIEEAKTLSCLGVKELILVAQDVTKYGYDFDNKYHLCELIEQLNQIEGIKWIRLMYCYPELIDANLIYTMSHCSKVCHYIDMPLQHINNDILKLMNRHNTKEQANSIIYDLRDKIKDIAIRTTFIIGLPSENKAKFNELVDFVARQKLTHVGFFSYSKEEGTRASTFKHQVPKFIKKRRLNTIASIQKDICIDNNNQLVGQQLEIVVDSIVDNIAICRSMYQAPDIDNNILIINNNLEVGQFYQAKITAVDANGYDIIGEII